MRSDFCRRTSFRAIPAFSLSGAIIAAALVSGCHKTPGGQVVAVVNGQEITQQDVRTQALSENLTSRAAVDAATPRIVQQMVDRTILADYARANQVDRAPEYVARRRQMDETLLAYLGLRKLVGNLKSPGSAEVKQYIGQNPLMFSQRQRLNLDQIRFSTPADQGKLAPLIKLNSLDDVAAQLKSQNVKFTRIPAYFDTGNVEKPLAQQIARLRDGEVFNLSAGGTTYFSQIKSRVAAVTNSSTWEAQALSNMRRKMLSEAVASKVGNLKKSAKIDYDPAYRPRDK